MNTINPVGSQFLLNLGKSSWRKLKKRAGEGFEKAERNERDTAGEKQLNGERQIAKNEPQGNIKEHTEERRKSRREQKLQIIDSCKERSRGVEANAGFQKMAPLDYCWEK